MGPLKSYTVVYKTVGESAYFTPVMAYNVIEALQTVLDIHQPTDVVSVSVVEN